MELELNLLTKEVAAKKTCPLLTGTREIMEHCRSDGCMMWRWKETVSFGIRADAAFKQHGRRLRPETGYCGLAGQP